MNVKNWILALFLILTAAFVRLIGLDKKFYWIDEVSSSFVITGNWPESIDTVLGPNYGKAISVGTVLDSLENHANFSSARLLSDLKNRDPQHSPLYFLIAQKWSLYFGARPENLRSLSVVIGIVSLVSFAWLAYQLFNSTFICLISLSVVTLSPFHILYSQQNREYSLWFLITCLSTSLLVAASRSQKKIHWLGYTISIAAGLYSFLFFLPFLGSHVLFQIVEFRAKRKPLKTFFVSFSVGCLLFLPWLVNILSRTGQVEELNSWSSKSVSPSQYLQTIILNFSRLFADFNLPSFEPLPFTNLPIILSVFVVIGIIACSLVYTFKSLRSGLRILAISIFIIPILFLFSMDLYYGGIHALVGRHLIPTWIVVFLCVGFTLASGIKSQKSQRKYLALSFLFLIFLFGIQFNLNYLPEKRWWPLKPQDLADASNYVLTSQAEILITSEPVRIKHYISMCYYLDRKFPILIVKDIETIPDLSMLNRIALYLPSDELQSHLSKTFKLTKFNESLWIAERHIR